MPVTLKTQNAQTVLYLMDISVGKAGIDGDFGPDTNKGLRQGADKIYAAMAARMTPAQAISTVAQGDIGTRANMEKMLLDRLKDPEFRANALKKLEQVQPPTSDSIKATKVILIAAGHDIPKDPATGVVSGKMDKATEFALNNTENGRPNAAAYAALNIPSSAIQVAMRPLGGQFNDAVVATSPAPAQSMVSAAPKAQPEIIPQRGGPA